MPAAATSRCRQLKNYKTYTILLDLLDLKVSPMSDISRKTSDEFFRVPYIPGNLFKLLKDIALLK